MATPIEIAVRVAGGSQARAQLRAVRSDVTKVGTSVRRIAVGGAAALGIAGLARGMVGFARSSVQAEAEFSTTMRLIAAATKAPADQMRELERLAIDMGARTQFSAGEASDAMLELAKAGVDVRTIMRGGIQGTLQLAAAGGVELGTAATIASNALNAFNLEGRDMASVAAALAGGANASSASVESLGQGLSQVSAGAVNAGLSLQETVAALSAFDAAGIKGSDAGTSLKTMLQRLVPSTTKAADEMRRLGLDFTDARGEFLPLTGIAAELQREFRGMSAEQRNASLATIFGSDATRAATVLMRQGASGVREFVKATRDQDAAQKMANARMAGTEGALERLSGAVETVKLRVGQELAGAVQGGADALGDNLVPMVESAIDAAHELGDALAPAVDAVRDVLRDLAPSAGEASAGFDLLVTAVRAGSELLGGVVRLLGLIPEPLEGIALQAGLAALALPRLTSAASRVGGAFTTGVAKVRQFGAELTYAETRAQRLGGALRGAAGVGGMIALQQGAQRANTAVGDLLTVAGMGAGGFAAGGPLGAIVGVAAGAFMTYSDNAQIAADRTAELKAESDELRATLDETTGALTRQTRELVATRLQQAGAFTAAQQLGIVNRDLVGAALGQEGAQRRVAAAYREASADLRRLAAAGELTDGKFRRVTDALDMLRVNVPGLRRQINELQREQREAGQAAVTWGEALRGLPQNVRTQVRALGADATAAELGRLQRRYDLTPKRLQTIIRALGTDTSLADIRRWARGVEQGGRDAARSARRGGEDVGRGLRDGTARARPEFGPFSRAMRGDVGRFVTAASAGARNIVDRLRSGTATARPNLDGFAAGLGSRLRSLEGTARSGGNSVGSAIGSGLVAGLGDWLGDAFSAGARLAAQAIAGARSRRGADTGSPSRKSAKVGRDIAAGLARGMQQGREGARQSAEDVARRLIRQLEQSTAKLRNLTQQARDYASAIRDAVVQTGNVTALETPEGEALTPAQMLDQLQARLRDAQRFAELIRQLRDSNLNRTTIDQLLQAGIEGGGLAAAETLLAGGRDTIREVNTITADLQTAAQDLGQQGRAEMYGAGIAAVRGLLQGLRRRARDLDGIGRELARRLAAAVRESLGIRSPSSLFRGIGEQTVEGLRIGLDDQRVRRYGELLASSLETGFARPRLAAEAAWGSAVAGAGSGPTLRVRLTGPQVSQLQRGREIQLDLDAYRSEAGPGRTF